MIRLFDSIAGEVRELETREPGHLSMYVCGPTVYDLPHLGHGRYFLIWDVARRWFSFRGMDVTYVSNITDIDDNIIERALRDNKSEQSVAREFEDEHWKAMDLLGIRRPDVAPRATEYLEGMVSFVASLLESGVAYTTSDGVYFDVSSVPDYGVLAGQPLDSLRAGARVEMNDKKRSPLDFALWKNAKPNEPSWPAPFGDGRPGWHTECVVMSLQLLGDNFDLHTGGFDLKFPHHENERAQALASHHVFARHWSHSGWVMAGNEKMSKSLNNFTSLTDLVQKTDPRAYRLLVLRSHYRSPLEVTPDTIVDAERALNRLDTFARRFSLPALAGKNLLRASDVTWSTQGRDLYERFGALLDEDLDTPSAIALLFESVSTANSLADEGKDAEAAGLANAVNARFGSLGLTLVASGGVDIDDATAALVQARDDARATKDWAEADRIRDELVAAGWVVEDAAGTTHVRRT